MPWSIGSVIRERVVIRAPLEQVWRVVADPALLPRWNGKIVRVMPDAIREAGPGYRFRVTHRFGRRVETRRVEIDGWQPPSYLRMTSSGGGLPPGAYATETWSLDSREGATHVEQAIDLSNAAIPIAARVLMVLLHRIGKPAGGDRYLDVLRELIEGGHLGAAEGNAGTAAGV